MGEPQEEQGDTKIEIKDAEHVQASLRVRQGGNQPIIELECKVVVTLDKINDVPNLVVSTLNEIYSKWTEG